MNINKKEINIYFVDKFTHANEHLEGFVPSSLHDGYMIFPAFNLKTLTNCSGIKKVKLPAIILKKDIPPKKQYFSFLHELSHYIQIKKYGFWRKAEENDADKDAKKWIKHFGDDKHGN